MNATRREESSAAGEPMPLLAPYRLGPIALPHRAIMSPMGRNRSGPDDTPTDSFAVYYAQRTSAGLIITESTKVSYQGVGHPRTPGIHLPQQIAGWHKVTEAVHAKGGHIFVQVSHVGRMSHRSQQKGGLLPVAPSAIKPNVGKAYEGMQPYETPRALETDEMPGVVDQFRQAAKNALDAGFDGVEILGGGGWLIDQFVRDGTNKRTDAYGGPIANRARLAVEVTEAVVEIMGADRVGFLITPFGNHNDLSDSTPVETFCHLVEALDRIGIAYLNVVDQVKMVREPPPPEKLALKDEHEPDWGVAAFLAERDPFMRRIRETFRNALVVNGGYDRERGNAAIASGQADLVGYGRLWISNPDLAKRYRLSATLTPWDASTFYGGDDRGYTDYPFLED